VFEDLGEEFSGFTRAIQDLKERLEEGRFRLAVLGQFKRGKSTLLNALIGKPLLPTGVLPLTSVPTVLRYGAEPSIRITRIHAKSEEARCNIDGITALLRRYVTEQENPGNRLGVSHVDVTYPNPLLSQRLDVIDTPGIGSTIPHNTQTAREMLQVADGAVFVLSPDPPITEVELQFLRAVRGAATRTIFVITKADTLTPTQRVEMLDFVRQVLAQEDQNNRGTRIFLVSAAQGLEARVTDNVDLWAKSGMADLIEYLTTFIATEKRIALEDAIEAKAARVIREALFTVGLQLKIIRLPMEELEQRSERFELQLEKIEQERRYFPDRLAGDRQRLMLDIEHHATVLAAQARETLATRAKKTLQRTESSGLVRDIQHAIQTALAEETEPVFARIEKELICEASHRFTNMLDTYIRDIQVLIDRVRRIAADLFEVPCLECVMLEPFERLREVSFTNRRWITSFTEEAASWLWRLSPRSIQLRRLENDLQRDIDYLVSRNIGEVRWAMQQNLQDACAGFQSRMEEQLDAAVGTIRASIASALHSQAERVTARSFQAERWTISHTRLVALLEQLSTKTATYQPPI
jgi:GTP-binding protein EngB required for normal cell division